MEETMKISMDDQLKRLYFDSMGKNSTDIESVLEDCDLEDMAEELLHYPNQSDPYFTESLGRFIAVLNYIDEGTEIPVPVGDELYDQLLEIYKTIGGTDYTGISSYQEVASNEEKTGYHKYPEIRGTLGKVYFIWDNETPEGDARHSLEDYYYNVKRQMNALGKSMPKTIMIVCALKYDGTSQVFECEKGKIKRVLTRYKVELNLGKDITHVYEGSDFKLDIPDYFKKLPAYGVKTECYMKQDDFEKYKSDYGDTKCNRRSAITSIVNRSEERMDHALLKYISIRPFQISSETYIEIPDWDPVKNPWYYCGVIANHHQWIWTGGRVTKCIDFTNPAEFLKIVNYNIPIIKDDALRNHIPIDGVVVTLLNDTIIEAVGRKNDRNVFQIAYKIPAGIAKTTIKDVVFQVGPATGTVTPVAILEPVVINGNTIRNATLSNFAKMEKLNLHIGDEVMIKYDIIPKLYKNETCNLSGGKRIVPPKKCPVCKESLTGNRCENPNCPSKVGGKIYNYIRKLGIAGFGKQTVNDLVMLGVLHTIPDLYQLELHRDKILSSPGFGRVSFEHLVQSVNARRIVYPHEILGAVGIPDIATKTTKLICRQFSLVDLIANPDGITEKLVQIDGIGEKKAKKLEEGIRTYRDILLYLVTHLTLKEYPEENYSQTVTFTNVRDKDFEHFLKEHGVDVSESWVSKVSLVIAPDGKPVRSTKIKKAESAGVPVVPLEKAKEMFHYNG